MNRSLVLVVICLTASVATCVLASMLPAFEIEGVQRSRSIVDDCPMGAFPFCDHEVSIDRTIRVQTRLPYSSEGYFHSDWLQEGTSEYDYEWLSALDHEFKSTDLEQKYRSWQGTLAFLILVPPVVWMAIPVVLAKRFLTFLRRFNPIVVIAIVVLAVIGVLTILTFLGPQYGCPQCTFYGTYVTSVRVLYQSFVASILSVITGLIALQQVFETNKHRDTDQNS